jgi:hypothetical protein
MSLAFAEPVGAVGDTKVLSILVMGDSYSAGNGAGSYYGPKGCWRSPNNYAREYERLVEKAPLNQRASVKNVACSGDKTWAITSSNHGRPPQLDAVSKDQDLVLLTIGGNNLKFANIVQYCLIGATRDGANCNDLLGQAERALKAGDLERSIKNSLYLVRNHADARARIVLLGYPYLEGDPSYRLRSGHGGNTFVDVGKRLRRIGDLGDELQNRVVNQLNAEQKTNSFAFINTKALFEGPPSHELFAKRNNKNRWFVQPFIDVGFHARATWYHPNPTGWHEEARLLLSDARVPKHDVVEAPKPAITLVTRQTPVTPEGNIAPGFLVTDSAYGGTCGEGSDVGQAYRCFTDSRVLDPCYAIAEPGTGDGTGVVCPISPFGNQLYELDDVIGLGRLETVAYDEPNGIVLASGPKCTLVQGAHGTDTKGRVIDYYCDDSKTAIVRGGVHKNGQLWTADTARAGANYTYVPSGNQPVRSAVLLQHDVPPANRPVTDAGSATADELDNYSRVHHEVDCGWNETTASGVQEEILTSGAPCYEASLVVTDWDNGDHLEPGWSCTYDDAWTLLCQKSDSVRYDDVPAFFSSTHIRALSG